MTLETRLEALENEVLRLRKNTNEDACQYYQNAMLDCRAYFESVRVPGQDYGAQMKSAEIARHAFREKHKRTGPHFNSPSRYITTAEEGEELFRLYKNFLAVYQNYLHGNKSALEGADNTNQG